MADRPSDPVAFREWLGIRPYSPAWRVTIKALYGTPLDPAERPLWRQLSGHGEERPGVGWLEAFFNVGRGGGKDDATKTIVNYECVHGGHEIAAAPGQRIPALVLCPYRNQSAGLLAMVAGEARLPRMRKHVANVTREGVEYANGLVAQIQTADDVAVVGDTVPLAVRNEWALMPNAHDIDTNLRPSLRQIVGAPPHRLIGISSSYVRSGLAWETYRDHFGKADTDVLVVQGSTETFNPNVDRDWLAKERRRLGERVAAMHFDCEWQDAIQEGWFADLIDYAIAKDVTKRPAAPGVRYVIAIDPAFAGDNFAVSVAHAERRDEGPPSLVQDYAYAWKPRLKSDTKVSVDEVALGVAALCDAYGTRLVFVDQHGGEPLRHVFARRNVTLTQRPWTGQSKAPTYRLIRDAMAERRVSLLDIPEQTREFHAIRGELLPSGVERIEAAYGHDDRVSAAVMSLSEAAKLAHWGGSHAYSDARAHRPAGGFVRPRDLTGELDTTGLPRMAMYPPRNR